MNREKAPIQFKWTVIICDDRGQDDEKVDIVRTSLQRRGINVTIVRNEDDFKRNLRALRGANVVLMDMNWPDFGSEHPVRRQVPPTRGNDDEQFLEAWLQAISSWSHHSAIEKYDSGWPRRQMSANEVGLWLAAMLSHIAPNAQFVMFSNLAELVNGGFGAALGRFSDARYEIRGKGSVVSEEDAVRLISRPLERAQAAALVDAGVYEWFLSHVYLPLLLDCEPMLGRLHRIDAATSQGLKQEYDPNVFFPDLKTLNRSDKLIALSSFIRSMVITDQQWSSLCACGHEIDKEKCERLAKCTYDKAAAHVRRGIEYAGQAGDYGHTVSSLLAEALKDWPSKFLDRTAKARACIDRIGEGDFTDCMIHLCEEYNAPVQGMESLRQWRIYDTNPGALHKAVAAIKSNADKHGAPVSVDVICEDHSCAVTLLTEWSNLTDEEFKAKTIASVKAKGAHRGLPYALLCGVLYGASRIQYRIGPKWRTIYPVSEHGEECVAEGDNSLNFGFRWHVAAEQRA